MSTSKYRVVGPRGEGPFEVDAESTIEAAKMTGLGYGLNQPRGPHGLVIAYEQRGNVGVKVGPFDITWLSRG